MDNVINTNKNTRIKSLIGLFVDKKIDNVDKYEFNRAAVSLKYRTFP